MRMATNPLERGRSPRPDKGLLMVYGARALRRFLDRERSGRAEDDMMRALRRISVLTPTAFMIGCGYTQLRSPENHRGPMRVNHVQRQSDIEFSDRVTVFARELVLYGRDSLSHAQSDSIDRTIVCLVRKMEKSGLESCTQAEREFLSLVVTTNRHRWPGPPGLYKEQTDSRHSDEDNPNKDRGSL